MPRLNTPATKLSQSTDGREAPPMSHRMSHRMLTPEEATAMLHLLSRTPPVASSKQVHLKLGSSDGGHIQATLFRNATQVRGWVIRLEEEPPCTTQTTNAKRTATHV